MHERLVVMGASAGGIEALRTIVSGLPAGFPHPIVVVQHIGPHRSILPELLERAGTLKASHASDGQPLTAGHVHIAPPDRHVIINGGELALSHGPKENHTRPAIDPLFRSAALEHGPRVVGLVLTGWGDDGTAGLQAIKACGGIAVVQEPMDALYNGMPMSAVRHVAVDHCVSLGRIAATLVEVTASGFERQVQGSPTAVYEQAIFSSQGNALEHLQRIGTPSPYVCPDCHGGLWALEGTRPRRYRCHTGHGFTLRSLQAAQSETTDEALWSAIRALQEQAAVLTQLARMTTEEGDTVGAEKLERSAREILQQAKSLRQHVERIPDQGTTEQDAPAG